MWKNTIRNKKFWFGIIISCAGLWVALRGVRYGEVAAVMSSVPWAAAIGFAFVSLGANVIRSYRWKIGIECFSPVSFKNVFSAFHVGIFGLNVIPARVGEYLRVYVLSKNSSISQSSILATVVFERIMDGLTILTIFAAAMMCIDVGNPDSVVGGDRKMFIWLVLALFAACLAFLYASWKRPALLISPLRKIAGLFGKAGGGLPAMAERFLAGLVIFSDVKRMLLYIAWSFISWLTIVLYLYLNFHILEIPLGFPQAIVVLAISVVGAMVPAAPGFVGTYHFFCQFALSQVFDVDKARALSFAVITHALPYVLSTILGFACFLRENVHWTDISSDGTAKAAR